MHEILVNRLGGLSLPRKSVVRLTDRPDMTLDVYRGRKTTTTTTTTEYNWVKGEWVHFREQQLIFSYILEFTEPVWDYLETSF